MSHDVSPDQPSEIRQAAYDAAQQGADAAQEAVGDAEDELVDAERARDAHRAEDGASERAEHDRAVTRAENAWHARRHDAYAASQARDAARDDLGDDGSDDRTTGAEGVD